MVFVYPGQASSLLPIGQYLYETEPVFREVLDFCNARLVEEKGVTLLDATFGMDGTETDADGSSVSRNAAVNAVECALTAFWRSVGVNRSAVAGLGLGEEIAAAQCSGAISLEDGLRLAANPRAMLPTTKGSGNGAISEPLAGSLARIDLSPQSVPLINAADGYTAHGGRAPSDHFWNPHPEWSPTACAKASTDLGVGMVIEMSPLSLLGLETLQPLLELGVDYYSSRPPALAPSVGNPSSDAETAPDAGFLNAVAKAYEEGLGIDFPGLLAGESRRRVPLPAYPFQRSR